MKGFIDLQVNGFRGIDFSRAGLTIEDVRQAVYALRDGGTVAFCPTIITSPVEVYEQNLPVLARAMEEPDLGRHLLGIHVEGPFISPEDGARGAHAKEFVRPPSVDLYRRFREWAEDKIVLVTVAPERPGACDLIEHITESGAVVSLGHHLADRETIARATDAGAKAATHLGNGIPNMLPRHPNPIWDQLDENRLAIMLITDGHHLPETFIRVVAKLTGPQRMIAVSDAAPIAGFPPGKYQTLGQEVILEESGRLWNPRGNHLVGSSASMFQCMNYLASITPLSESELLQVGYFNPLTLLERKLDEHLFADLPDVAFTNGRFLRPGGYAP